MNYLILCVLWVMYFIAHSFFASARVKFFFAGILVSRFRYYRIFYSLISTIGLFLLLFLNASISTEFIFASKGMIRYLSLMLATLGVIVIIRSFREYKLSSFIGLKDEPSEFKRTGILNHVRHPIYSGTILIVIGFFLFNPTLATLVSVCCTLAYLPVGIYLEERKLIEQFGKRYLSYKQEVPCVFPDLRKLSFQKTSK